jgi:hypothetical protein
METIALGITCERLQEEKLFIYTVEKFGVEPLLRWSKAIADSLNMLPDPDRYLAIHDVSQTGVSLQYLLLTGYNILDPWLTPASEKHFLDIKKAHPKFTVKLAIVVSSQLSGQLASRRGRTSVPNYDWIESQIFDDRESAIAWFSDKPEKRDAS